jgi:hypothetical protein
MDLQAHTLIGTASPRWAKVLALACFAVAGGLLIESLADAQKAGSAARSSASIVFHAVS